MELTALVVALNVLEELTEASVQGRIPLHRAHSGAHPCSGMVGTDLIILSLQNIRNNYVSSYVSSGDSQFIFVAFI